MLGQFCKKRSVLFLAAAIAGGLFVFGVGLPRAVQAQQPDLSTQLYVSRIGVVYHSVGGPKRLPSAVVDIVDGNGQPVNGALVVGDWSGCRYRERNISDVTETVCWTDEDGTPVCQDGEAKIWATKSVSCMKPCYITFTITSVSKDGMTYVPVEGRTTDSDYCL